MPDITSVFDLLLVLGLLVAWAMGFSKGGQR